MNSVKPWLIKVLNGPNAGAQILISQSITVGTSIDCDLILNDPHICSIHCEIKREQEEGFEITPKEGVVFINGTKLESETGTLKLGDVLTLGSTHLTGGPGEQLWPPVTIPEFQEIGAARQEEKALSEGGTLSALDATKEKKQKQRTFSKFSLLVIIIIGVCSFMGLVLIRIVARRNLIVTRSEFEPSSFEKVSKKVITPTEQSAAEEAAKALQKKFPQLTIKIIESNGDPLLYVYAHNQLQYDEIRKFINEAPILVITNIITTYNIDNSALAMVQAMNLSVSIVVDRNTGKVTWTGYIPNQALLDSFKQQIAKDLPAITEQEFHIILGETAVAMARGILIGNRFESINVTPERQSLTLTGVISLSDNVRWEKTVQELEKEFYGKVKLVNMVLINTNAIQDRGFFNAPVVSVSISCTPYAVLQNGERIFLGAKVKEGYVVDSITTNGIGLKNESGDKLIPLTGE